MGNTLVIRDNPPQGILEENDIHTNRIAGIEIKQDASPIVMKCRIHHGCTGGVYIHDRVRVTGICVFHLVFVYFF